MTRARHSIVDIDSTPYYHCIGRCVRRAFLCGEDHVSGKSFEHRRAWIVERLDCLAKIFAIDIASYAVMSNHYHVVLRVDKDRARNWSEANVIRRWKRLFSVTPLVQRYQKESVSEAVEDMAKMQIAEWRTRLMDISWFMRCLNEFIARKANDEDNCTGRFWEGRFKSQPLLDEAAVLTAMAYVDLNPIRADMAKSPEASDYTSVQQRIFQSKNKPCEYQAQLMKLSASSQQSHKNSIAFSLTDYLELVDWSGRQLRDDKRGAISLQLPPILERLNLEPEGFINLLKRKDDISGLTALGSPTAISHYAEHIGKKFIKGIRQSERLFL